MQGELRALARKILDDSVSAGTLAAYDEFAAPRFDRGLWQTLLDSGLPGIAVAEEYGGMGLGFMELGLFIEELGRSIAPVPVLAHCVSGRCRRMSALVSEPRPRVTGSMWATALPRRVMV